MQWYQGKLEEAEQILRQAPVGVQQEDDLEQASYFELYLDNNLAAVLWERGETNQAEEI